jgi:regulator of RNase E activity RraA
MLPKKYLYPALAVSAVMVLAGFQAARQPTTIIPNDPMLAAFGKVAVASISDAIDQVVQERGFLSHQIRPRSEGRIVGRAVTSLVRKVSDPALASPALSTRHSVEIIDNGKPGEVAIIVMEDGLDVAAIGGLMATAAKSRGMEGIVVDGGVRDILELRALKLPVYSSSVSPATAVGRWATVDKNVPVKCGDVVISPGDVVIAGEDGLVRVPAARAKEVLQRAQEIDDREMKMVPHIQRLKSLSKVIQMFNRI